MAEQQTLGELVAVDMTTIGAVVGFTDQRGQRRLSSWEGKTKLVWAKFKEGALPPLMDMRDEMLAAYEPTNATIPDGLLACICFEADANTPWIPRVKDVSDNPVCLGCPQFKQCRANEGRNERNCLKWLCCGGSGCPHKSVIAQGKQ